MEEMKKTDANQSNNDWAYEWPQDMEEKDIPDLCGRELASSSYAFMDDGTVKEHHLYRRTEKVANLDRTKKYYSVLRKGLGDKDSCYKKGLNIQEDGIKFFEAKDILHCAMYADILVDVKIPDDAIVYKFDGYYKANKIIMENDRPLYTIKNIKELYEQGLDVHENDDFVFRQAARHGRLDLVKYLLDLGADIHACDYYDSHDYTFCLKDDALRGAVTSGHLDIVKFLVNHGADISVVTDCAGCDPTDDDYGATWSELRSALLYEYFDVVDYLVDQGVDILEDGGYTLHLAVECGKLKVVKYLVEHGVNCHSHNERALKLAKENGHEGVMKYIKAQE